MATKKTDEAQAETISTSRELPKPNVVSSDAGDPAIGWTAQVGFVMPEDEIHSEGAVPVDALPTKEGLDAVGVLNQDAYLANIAVAE